MQREIDHKGREADFQIPSQKKANRGGVEDKVRGAGFEPANR